MYLTKSLRSLHCLPPTTQVLNRYWRSCCDRSHCLLEEAQAAICILLIPKNISQYLWALLPTTNQFRISKVSKQLNLTLGHVTLQ